jgi:Protein of unknown function
MKATRAINRAEDIISGLDHNDRMALATPLGQVVSALYFEVLHAIYVRYPDLRLPPRGQRFIDAKRRWKEVVLPESVSENDLDAIIFSSVTRHYRKVALVISKAFDECKARALPIDHEVIGVRIRLLTETGRLESQGDVRKWRFSEVRLPASGSPE